MDMLNIALPKGRLGEKVYSMFEKAGFECPSIKENNRKLIFENKELKLRFFWVKPSDVAIYFDALDRKLHVKNKLSTDAIIIYNENSDINTLADFCNKLESDGISFNTVITMPEKTFGAKIYSVDGTDIKEVTLW